MMKVVLATLALVGLSAAFPANPAPYHPAQDPYYSDEPVVLCANYPYCSEAPFGIYHLQAEIEALRQRTALITKVGENLHLQQPNRPFVGGYQNL